MIQTFVVQKGNAKGWHHRSVISCLDNLVCLVLSQNNSSSSSIVGMRLYEISRVFSKCTRMAIMPILASEALFHENKKFQWQNATLASIEPLDLWFQVQHYPLHTNLAFACKTETLSSLYNHALNIKSKHQVVIKIS